ncbi:MAG: hypothetical protein CFK49_10470 [Armatimonadetes bacterium JP3_11]|nr:MAG: hypothetical protein CFK48_07375 [Armatimonadetes bacterium CP1_7O]OYT73472.1 MAG: hypothetical protein CFK49_10470 [Armatimonadetes bacterium JP3_11]RMH08754.1 MAG: DUF2089 domain-containing protein [Armatimonadota bacterium]
MRRIMKERYAQPTRCPICSGKLIVTQVTCEDCATSVQGQFLPNRFSQLDPEQLQFLEVFLRNRGMLAGVERELGISYPTARNKLDALLLALGLTPATTQDLNGHVAQQRREILDLLEQGQITAEEAARKLRSLR